MKLSVGQEFTRCSASSRGRVGGDALMLVPLTPPYLALEQFCDLNLFIRLRCVACGDLSSPTKDPTRVPCSGSAES